jgi:HicA toxin of bacterial toxin-antitoxin,
VVGSHHEFLNPKTDAIVTVPHPRKDFPIGTLRAIFRQAGWPTAVAWRELAIQINIGPCELRRETKIRTCSGSSDQPPVRPAVQLQILAGDKAGLRAA